MKDLTHYFNIGRNSCAVGSTVGSCASDPPQASKKVEHQELIDLCDDADDDDDDDDNGINHDPLCISCDRHKHCIQNDTSKLCNGTVPSIKEHNVKDSAYKQSKRLKLNRSKERLFMMEKYSQSEENRVHAKAKKINGESCEKWFKLKHDVSSKDEENSKRKLNFNDEDISNSLKRMKCKQSECEYIPEQKESITKSNKYSVLENIVSVKESLNSEQKLKSEKTEDITVPENKCKVLINDKPKRKPSLKRNKISLSTGSVITIEYSDMNSKTNICIDLLKEESSSPKFKMQQKCPEQSSSPKFKMQQKCPEQNKISLHNKSGIKVDKFDASNETDISIDLLGKEGNSARFHKTQQKCPEQNKISLHNESGIKLDKCDASNETDIRIDLLGKEGNSARFNKTQQKCPEQNKISLHNESVIKVDKSDVSNETDICVDLLGEGGSSARFNKTQKWPEQNKNESCVSSMDVSRSESSCDSDIIILDSLCEKALESPISTEKNIVRNGLFKYFTKVNKGEYIVQTENQKITVEAVVHSVPGDVNKSPRLATSAEKVIHKRNRSKITEQLNSSDRIDIISSEPLITTDKDSDKSVCESSSFHFKTSPTNCAENINTLNNENTFLDGNCTDLEKHVHNVKLCNSKKNRKCDVNTMVLKKKSSSSSDNKKYSSDPSGSRCRSWVMRVRLNSNTTKENPPEDVSEEEEESQNSSDSWQCAQLEPSSDTESGLTEVEYGCTLDSVLNDCPVSNTENGQQKVEGLQKSTPVQLCAIFLKNRKSAKCVPDPQKLEAVARFLESGTPDILKRTADSHKSENQGGIPAQFPTVSHVQQHDLTQIVWNNAVSTTLKLRPPLSPLQPPTPLPWSSLGQYLPPRSKPASKLIPVVNRKESLKKLIEQEPEMDVKSWYKSFTERRQKNSVTGEPVADTFTDTYKPVCAADIIGNMESVGKLKAWLESHKKCLKKEGSDSSGDEFVNEFDSDEEEENKRVNSIVILCGPHGCGKTSTVYALANELGYKVLEINASCNRSGKRILSELSESTQSHHVEHSQSQLVSYYMPGKRRKNKKNTKGETNESVSRKTSLILVEDADLLFCDHDEGFLNAITTLAAASKRPIILVTNNPNCPHLMKFSDCLAMKLLFTKPRASRLGVWLCTLALVEGVLLSKEQAMELVEMNNRDVRRCLLQLQVWILSEMSQESNEVTGDGLWWQWPSEYNLRFYLPTISGPESETDQELTDKKQVRQVMDSIAKLTDRLSTFDGLTSKYRKAWFENPCPLSWKVMPKDGTSLQNPTGGEIDRTASEIYSWLADSMKGEIQETILHGKRTNSNAEIRWRSLLWQAQDVFLQAISSTMHCSHQVIACDYLPMLRTVGRSERIRLAVYSRRGNRFFNYLQNLGIRSNKSFKDFMCDMFA